MPQQDHDFVTCMASPMAAQPEKASKPPPPGVGFVLDITVQRLTKLAILVAIIAWLLTRESCPRTQQESISTPFAETARHEHAHRCRHSFQARSPSPIAQPARNPRLALVDSRTLVPAETSGRLLFNVPLALAMVAGLRWLALNVDVRYRGSEGPRKDWRRRKHHHGGGGSNSQQGSSGEGAAPHKEGRWREKVRAPVVEHAWEMLCGSIIQQARLGAPGSS